MPMESKYVVVGPDKITISSTEINTIKIAMRLFGLSNNSVPFVALLTVDINNEAFNNIINYYKPSENSLIFIIDDSGSIISGSDPSSIGKKLETEKNVNFKFFSRKDLYGSSNIKVNNLEMLLSYKKLPGFSWTIVSLSPLKELYGELISFKNIMYVVLILCIFFVVLISLLLSENVSYPIRKLAKSMATVQNGNFDIKLEYKRNDEFSYLINTYKIMVAEIKELIGKLFLSEVNKKEAELKSLQSQINPHFLYNTLDSVNWLAMKHNVPDISTMVTSLSDFFRYSLSKGQTIIPLADELKQVESYLAIQKIRFKDKLDYTINASADTLECLSVKLILQPIVENAIIHGIEKRRGKGSIYISSEKLNDIIEITISDDGIGSDIKDLNALLENKNDVSKSYGLRNVNERIKQTFGNEYGVKFYNNQPTGVKVVISIPVSTCDKITTLEDFYVKDDHS
jgi:two-component system, sensor histidine kinase YesM